MFHLLEIDSNNYIHNANISSMIWYGVIVPFQLYFKKVSFKFMSCYYPRHLVIVNPSDIIYKHL